MIGHINKKYIVGLLDLLYPHKMMILTADH